jgi:hypothetical protein
VSGVSRTLGPRFSGTVATRFALALVLSVTAHAQRGRQTNPGEKPAVDVVQAVGCAERRDGNPETWWLTRAADPRSVQPGVFSTGQVDAAKGAPLGANSFQLIGVADFLDTEGLLKSGRRREFTSAQNANATGELRSGRKVLVKGMFITSSDPKRINLLNVVALSDSCN